MTWVYLVSGTIAPAREIPKEDTLQTILANLNLVVPIVMGVFVIIVAIIVLCVLKGKGNYQKGTMPVFIIIGTIAPVRDSPTIKLLFPWIPEWVDWNIAVPVATTVVVVVVGIVVVCVALSRRDGPMTTRLRSDCMFFNNVYKLYLYTHLPLVYNNSMLVDPLKSRMLIRLLTSISQNDSFHLSKNSIHL